MDKRIEDQVIDALGVMVLDKRIREFLKKNDPKAYDQCVSALDAAALTNGRAANIILSGAWK